MGTNKFSTPIFTNIWESVDDFVFDYKNNGIETTITEEHAKLLFYLLYGRHGNDAIMADDEERWKYKLWSVIFQYGPYWEKNLVIQKELREMDIEELVKGNTVITNTAMNPGEEPTTQSLDELTYINNQAAQKQKRSKVDAYANLLTLLEEDVTERFLFRFDNLFRIYVGGDNPVIYETEE